MVCICGHDKHAFTEPTVCSTLSCKCEKYVEATPENPVPPDWQGTLDEMDTVYNKIAWLLENIKFLRNYDNTLFVDWFRKNVHDAKVETIARTKRKLVENNYARYGPFDASELEMKKQLHQLGIEEWVVSN